MVHFEDELAIQLEDRFVRPDRAPDYLAQDFTQNTPNTVEHRPEHPDHHDRERQAPVCGRSRRCRGRRCPRLPGGRRR
jgi:DNA-binding GntR family transcriptional regulator